jgi:hypothetical protein
MDHEGMRFIRKADNEITLQMDIETGSARFAGDISGASGTFGDGSVHIGEDGIQVYGYGTVSEELPLNGVGQTDIENPDASYPITNPTDIVTVKTLTTLTPFVTLHYKDAFIKFDLPHDIERVERATLLIDAQPKQGTPANYAWRMSLVAGDWAPSTLTFSNRPSTIEHREVDANSLRAGVNITDWVNAWLNNSQPNFGLCLALAMRFDGVEYQFEFQRGSVTCEIEYVDTDGGFKEERLKIGSLAGAKWGSGQLPAGTFGFYGNRSGLYLRGYATLLTAQACSDGDIVEIPDDWVINNPQVFLIPKDTLIFHPDMTERVNLVTSAERLDARRWKVRAKLVLRGLGQPVYWDSKPLTSDTWTRIQPTTPGGIEMDYIICRPMWFRTAAPLYKGGYAELWMDITDEFDANGNPINWLNANHAYFNYSGRGTLNWDMPVPKRNWAVRLRGKGVRAYFQDFGATGIETWGYSVGDRYMNNDGALVSADTPSGVQVVAQIFDQG